MNQTKPKQLQAMILALFFVFTGCTAQPMEVTPPMILESSPSQVIATRTYINTKYSFVFEYPAIFSQKQEDYNQEGIRLWEESIALAIWGTTQNNPPFAFLSNQTIVSSLQQSIKPLHIQTEELEPFSYYYGVKEDEDCQIHVLFTYPREQAEQFKALIGALEKEMSK